MTTLNAYQSSDLSLPSDSYIYSVVPTSTGLAAISSDDSLRLFGRENLRLLSGGVLKRVHQGVTCLKAFDEGGNILATAGSDGLVRTWDIRSGGNVHTFDKGYNGSILSLECCSASSTIVAGTELITKPREDPQASVMFWDIRSTASPRQKYTDSHNDDVTELQFHPTNHSLLVSGSTDGLVNVYNCNITDEEDALIQVINHGSSIHRAGFLNDKDIFALSHDETLSMYQLTDPDNEDEAPSPIVFGDIRGRLGCEYAIGVFMTEEGAILGIGNHSEHRLELVRMDQRPQWTLDQMPTLKLTDAHGDEIVRSLYIDTKSSTIYSSGEDGQVRAWKFPSNKEENMDGLKSSDDGHLSARRRKGASKGGRFNPY
ncbi:WD40 repeat-like protein [Xylona heveae TC161]|uniref:WD40 repeat-like protein n=1 Tax=Xylona heveae (strain CBS 132557 / TC161) TaxID=1328760 RepID=A0A165GDP7_XYLHT|nr:WD40 repeat-like protein [Xylona heveae TC161]KZF22067.1 WD40 repeat-like protein [Xylona heveae TC161]